MLMQQVSMTVHLCQGKQVRHLWPDIIQPGRHPLHVIQDDHKHAGPQVTGGIPPLSDLSLQSRQVLLPIDVHFEIALLWLVQLLTC